MFIILCGHRGIAQLVEYRSPKPWVAGSNPPAPAKNMDTPFGVSIFFVRVETRNRDPRSGEWDATPSASGGRNSEADSDCSNTAVTEQTTACEGNADVAKG